jgi:hypothetical protein
VEKPVEIPPLANLSSLKSTVIAVCTESGHPRSVEKRRKKGAK